jgi:hypothetical protein
MGVYYDYLNTKWDFQTLTAERKAQLARISKFRNGRGVLVYASDFNKNGRDRTIEQKISCAGPNPLRVDPHVLTNARATLEAQGTINCGAAFSPKRGRRNRKLRFLPQSRHQRLSNHPTFLAQSYP